MIFIERTIFGTTLHKTIVFAKRTNFQKKNGKSDSFFDTKLNKTLILYQTIDFFEQILENTIFFLLNDCLMRKRTKKMENEQ